MTEGFETTLKHNSTARYCRSYIAEHTRYLYPKECRAVLDWICTPKEIRPELDSNAMSAALIAEFINTPLSEMQAPISHTLAEILALSADIIGAVEL